MNQPADLSMEDYQCDLIENVRNFIGRSFLCRKPNLRILDSGCDTTGRQLRKLAELTKGEVVGINPASGFPAASAIEAAGDRVRLHCMDGTKLEFPDASFDLVVSANVMEHVPDAVSYVKECSRVLRPGGMAWIETAPCWTGPRGHHIHPDMIARHCPAETGYRNDGSVIPDWSHLRCSKDEMRAILNGRLRPETIDYILEYVYDSHDLNRTGWREIRAAIETEFPWSQIAVWNVSNTDHSLATCDGLDEYLVAGFQVAATKRRPNPILHAVTRRLYWRMRRAGI